MGLLPDPFTPRLFYTLGVMGLILGLLGVAKGIYLESLIPVVAGTAACLVGWSRRRFNW